MSDIVIRYFIAVLHFAGEKTLENAGLWGGDPHRGVAEGSDLLVMLRRTGWQIVPDVSQGRGTYFFRAKKSPRRGEFVLDCWTWKMKALRSFETLAGTNLDLGRLRSCLGR